MLLNVKHEHMGEIPTSKLSKISETISQKLRLIEEVSVRTRESLECTLSCWQVAKQTSAQSSRPLILSRSALRAVEVVSAASGSCSSSVSSSSRSRSRLSEDRT